jgi:short-subunit dehydrogenase
MAATLLFKRSRTLLVQNKLSLLLGIGSITPFINHHRFRSYSSSKPFVASSYRYESTKAQAQLEDFQQHDDHDDQVRMYF